MSELDVNSLLREAACFADRESSYSGPKLYGVNDGKTVGTYLEQEFQTYLSEKYSFEKGDSASGIDFPQLEVDIKTTSVRQPQSSCPFESARQKVYGLGYNILIFVYEKTDDDTEGTAKLDMRHTIYVDKPRTADYQMTRGILEIIQRSGNRDDIFAFINDKNLPVDEIEANNLADAILQRPPAQGYLTISNALQWRLQYKRVIQEAGYVDGVHRLR